jgi:nucleolar protein 9
MPKENKKRGRRADKKRKLETTNDEEEPSKRQRQEEEPVVEASEEYATQEGGEYAEEGEEGYGGYPGERPFYGLLDEEEQEYFRKAGEVLDLNQFPDAEERNAFVESVYREAEGKELKLANSQSCSRLFERLLRLSTASQLKKVFINFKEK